MDLWAVKEADGVRLRIVERAGWNGPPEELVNVVSHVAEQLRGQCIDDVEKVLEYTGQEHLGDNKEFLEALDSEVFLCETCGWWCEPSEMGEDHSCMDCSEEDGEEDD